jgi:hypothetical protein
MMGNPYVQVKLSDCQAIVASRRAEAQRAAQLAIEPEALQPPPVAVEKKAVAKKKKTKRARSKGPTTSGEHSDESTYDGESDVSSYSEEDSPKRKKTKMQQQTVTPPPGRTPKEIGSLRSRTYFPVFVSVTSEFYCCLHRRIQEKAHSVAWSPGTLY